MQGSRGALAGLAPAAVPASPAIDVAPPVTPNLVRARAIAGTGRVGRNALETLLFRGLSTPVALVLVVLQSRLLEPAGRGTFVLVVLSVTIGSRLLGQLGIAVTARLRAADVELRLLVHRAFALAVLVGLAACAPIVAWSVAAGDIGLELGLAAALALVPNILWQTVSGVLLGVSQLRLWNVIQLLPPVLTLVGMLVLVVGLDGGVRGAIAAWALAHLLTAAFALVAARGLWLPAARPRLADGHSRTLLRVALLLGAVQVVNLASYRIELFMLRRFEGLAEIGVYSITMQAAESIWLIPAALATAVTAPAVHEVEERAARLVVQAARRSLLLTAAVAAAVGVAAPFFIPLVLGEDFAGASLPLALLLPGVVAYAPVTVLVVYLSVRRGRPRLSLVVSLVGLAVTCTCAIPLIRAYGTGGAAVASSIGYAAGALLTWAFFVRLSGTGWLGRTRPAPL